MAWQSRMGNDRALQWLRSEFVAIGQMISTHSSTLQEAWVNPLHQVLLGR
jgi:hypothetical protein